MRAIVTASVSALLLTTGWSPVPSQAKEGLVRTSPDVVLIMVDDMGYSDLGCYGGEIETPHIDRLARNGIRFSLRWLTDEMPSLEN